MFQYPPSAKNAPAAKLTPSVNRLTMLGVIGNGMILRLIGMETLRFILAKIPSVGLTSQPSNFCSATWRCCSLRTRCHCSSPTGSRWTEWAETLGAELRAAGEDDGSRYCETWLRALERLSLSKGLTNAAALDQRTAAWADAYRRTPHGQPVELRGT